MRGELKHRSLIVALCLALFQVQLFAASTLGCLHDSDIAMSVGCPFHSTGDGAQVLTAVAAVAVAGSAAPMPADTDLLDCPKCALNLGLHYAVAAPIVIIASTPHHAEAHALPELHFYRFTPKRSKKPPIPADS